MLVLAFQLSINMNLDTFLKTLALLLFVLSFCSKSYGQIEYAKGYIINANGEKLSGLVGIEQSFFTPQEFLFKTEESDNPITFTSTAAKEIGYDKLVFVSASIQVIDGFDTEELYQDIPSVNTVTKKSFVQKIVEADKGIYRYIDNSGKVSFYISSHGSYHLLMFQRYFRQLAANQSVEEEISTYKATLLEQLEDCSDILPIIRNTDYNERSLRKLMEKYGTCTNQQVNVYPLSKSDKAYDITLNTGVMLTGIEFVGDETFGAVMSDYETSISPMFGANLNLRLSRTDKWFMNIGVLYTTLKTKGSGFQDYGSRTREVNGEIEITQIKLHTLIQRSIAIKRSSILLGLGLNYGLGNEKRNIQENISTIGQSRVVNEIPVYQTFNELELGIIGQAGFMRNKHSFVFRYEIGGGISRDPNFTSEVYRMYFIYGYSLTR